MAIEVVGLVGFEPTTSSLSGMHSNQLSYRPLVKNFPTWKINVAVRKSKSQLL